MMVVVDIMLIGDMGDACGWLMLDLLMVGIGE